ncbi:MAG: N-acetylmuramoyl-L-alanine amidase [Solirubrobacterales bacterium]|nr:N-acetylmuramoyl-L-alanine amidase [Solirubrobacterales bacterium]
MAVASRPAQTAQPVGRNGPIPFSPGACLGYAPTGRWNGVTVFLDPGHGGVDTGTMGVLGGRIVTEKEVTLAVGLRTLALLRAAGYRVVISRTRDSTVARYAEAYLHQGVLDPDAAQREVEVRDVCANAAHADILVSIHMNGFADRSANGTETFFCPTRPFAAHSRRLADLVQRALMSAFKNSGTMTFDRGVLPDGEGGGAALTLQTANYHHLIMLGPADRPWLPYPSRMPGVLVEPAFLTNPSQASFVVSGRGQEALARGLVAAIDSYFDRPGAA